METVNSFLDVIGKIRPFGVSAADTRMNIYEKLGTPEYDLDDNGLIYYRDLEIAFAMEDGRETIQYFGLYPGKNNACYFEIYGKFRVPFKKRLLSFERMASTLLEESIPFSHDTELEYKMEQRLINTALGDRVFLLREKSGSYTLWTWYAKIL